MQPDIAVHQDQLHFDQSYRFRFQPGDDTKQIERQYRPAILDLLRAAGIPRLQIGVCGANAPVDLVVNGHLVEVKIARNRRKARGNGHRPFYFQALLRDHNNHHYLNGNYVLLICVLETELCPFVIPVTAVGQRRTIEITSHPFTYAGQWAPYRGAFHLLREPS